MSCQPMHGWCMGLTDLKRRSAKKCAGLTLFSYPRSKIPSVIMNSTHEFSRSTCHLHIPWSPCCERCLVSRVHSPAPRAGSFSLLLESLVRPPGPTRTPDAYNCEDRGSTCLHKSMGTPMLLAG